MLLRVLNLDAAWFLREVFQVTEQFGGNKGYQVRSIWSIFPCLSNSRGQISYSTQERWKGLAGGHAGWVVWPPPVQQCIIILLGTDFLPPLDDDIDMDTSWRLEMGTDEKKTSGKGLIVPWCTYPDCEYIYISWRWSIEYMRTDWRSGQAYSTDSSLGPSGYKLWTGGSNFSPGGNAGHDRVHYHLDRIMDDSFSKRVRRRALRPSRPSNILSWTRFEVQSWILMKNGGTFLNGTQVCTYWDTADHYALHTTKSK
jgi:hypothetical protein